ncbi:interferon gamma receptor 1 [Rhineura floridana]|uniref:interferon gamma receptor 1 n=1 Tax=Rhineura floridana TaxID=261503 RepID=UPI002AC828FD|nr:interferon gamma receptor 1 [Rhineura floridana]
MGLAELLVVFAVLPSALHGEPGAWEPQMAVPPPTNIVIDSYNFNSSVQWDYESKSSKTLFVVKILCYGAPTAVEVSNCVNITKHYCDLTHKIDNRCHSFWILVKALSGLNESKYIHSENFHVTRHGRIGPPKLNLSIEDQEIKVDIKHPLTPYHGRKSPLNVRANFTDFAYKVFLWKSGSPEKRELYMTDEECLSRTCTISLHIPSWNTSYCVSAQGFSDENSIEGEESKESCIGLPSKHSIDLTVSITLGVVGFVILVVILAGICIWLSKKKRDIKLPKSLAAVVRNMNPVCSDSKPEGSVITSSSITPILSECEDEKLIDPIGEVKILDLGDSGKKADADNSQGALSNEGEVSLQEGIIVEISEGEQSSEENDNYFKSLSGQEEMCNSNPNLDLPGADMQQSTLLESCKIMSGYDRHRWLPPDVEESLNRQSSSTMPEA